MSELWIGRDNDNRLFMFDRKPNWHEDEWLSDRAFHGAMIELPVDILPLIKPGECAQFSPTGFIYAKGGVA